MQLFPLPREYSGKSLEVFCLYIFFLSFHVMMNSSKGPLGVFSLINLELPKVDLLRLAFVVIEYCGS